MPKIVKLGKLKKAVQDEFNHLIASGKPCAKCGQTFPVMQCSHIKSIGGHDNLRYDPMNVLPMCGHCHNFWYHAEPTESGKWFEQKYPGRYEYLLQAQNKHVGWTIDKVLEVRKKVKEKDLKGLLIMPELVLDNP